jgi:hypothetical protein
VASDNFGDLLTEYYNLFSPCALRELGVSISEATTLSVNIVIDYANGTMEWPNGTRISAGCTLFKLTQEIAVIKSGYFAYLELGHIQINSINGKATIANYTIRLIDGVIRGYGITGMTANKVDKWSSRL